MPDLSRRRLEPELMDQPGLDPAEHARALRALRRINALSGSAGILWGPIRRLARAVRPKVLRVLDLASGGGDVPVRLWQRARRAGLPIEVAGCDRSETAVAHATERAREAGAEVAFFVHDVISDGPPREHDVLACSLFLHHLTDDEARTLLRQMGERAGRMVLVNDLRRSRAGWLLAWAASRVLSRSPVVHFDGPQSVRAAFTPEEVLTLAAEAGLEGATVTRRWPFRLLLTWERT